MVQVLIAAGADVNATDFTDQSALFHATYAGSEAIALLLIGEGADVNQTSPCCHGTREGRFSDLRHDRARQRLRRLVRSSPGLQIRVMRTPAERLYETDFFAWTRQQARELRRFARTRPKVPLDLAHLAEEIADLGSERWNAVKSLTRRILEHLLLLQHSPAVDPRRGWIDEIVTFRSDIEDRLTPTLRRDLRRELPRLYERARRDLRRKLERYGEGAVADQLPEGCPWTVEQVLGDFWPPDRDDLRS